MVLALGAMVVLAYFASGQSSGTTFAVGEIDITIDNESYYNGVSHQSTSWELTDLTVEKFFDFADVKPGDYGEDTVSIHVADANDTDEDSFLCADVTLTSNDENGCNEPEAFVDGSCGDPGPDEGELAGLIEFMWWADDGDNVFEDDEAIISEGPLGALTLGTPHTVTLADSDTNIWTGNGGPVPEGTTEHIGKAWCYGDLAPQALEQDGNPDAWSPAGDNDGSGTVGEPEDGGFTCTGITLGNESQTDSVTLDVAFNAVQELGNDGYLCSDGEPSEPPAIAEGVGLPFYDGFGNGNTDDTWDEEEADEHIWEVGGAGAEKSGPAGQEESSSPDGDRFARMEGPDGSICIAIDATGFENLELEYYWRGDDEGTATDFGHVEYATGGTCALLTGVENIDTHSMDDPSNPPWVLNTGVDISAVSDSIFYLIFRADTSGPDVDFRIDGVRVEGTAI